MPLVRFLAHAHPFRQAPDDALELLASHANQKRLEHGQPVWRAGDPPVYFTIIQSGLLKIVQTLPNGRESILGLFGPRESVGDVAVLQGTPLPASAEVCSRFATVVRLPRDVLLDAMTRFPGLAMSVNHAIGDRIHALHTKVAILSAGGVDARLAALLLELAERFGDELDDGTVGIPLALSRQDLASLVSTTFETAVRVMSRWQKAGWVDTHSDGFTLKNMVEIERAATTVGGGRGG